MPSIAQQDYLRIVATHPSDIPWTVCEVLAGLAGAIAKGTIFDVVIEHQGTDGSFNFVRPFAVSLSSTINTISAWDVFNAGPILYEIEYTQTQYEGLAAIQDATEEYDEVPELMWASDYLQDSNGKFICVGGKKLSLIVTDSNTIQALAISDVEDADGLNISFEDAQKLIGLPLT